MKHNNYNLNPIQEDLLEFFEELLEDLASANRRFEELEEEEEEGK